jgi:RecA-family ATPase
VGRAGGGRFAEGEVHPVVHLLLDGIVVHRFRDLRADTGLGHAEVRCLAVVDVRAEEVLRAQTRVVAAGVHEG